MRRDIDIGRITPPPPFYLKEAPVPVPIPNIEVQLAEAHDLRKLFLAGRIDSKRARDGVVVAHYFVAPPKPAYDSKGLSEFAKGIAKVNDHTKVVELDDADPRVDTYTQALHYGVIAFHQFMPKPGMPIHIHINPEPNISVLIVDYIKGRMNNEVLNSDELTALAVGLSAKDRAYIGVHGPEAFVDKMRKAYMKVQTKFTPLGAEQQ